MKKGIFIILFFVISGMLSAQNQLERIYEYDASGNRTCRYVLSLPSPSEKSLASVQNENNNEKNDTYYVNSIGDIHVNVYPNPVKERLIIQINNYADFNSGELFLYTLDGKMLSRTAIRSNQIEINMLGYAAGTYLLKLQINGYHQEWKIIKN